MDRGSNVQPRDYLLLYFASQSVLADKTLPMNENATNQDRAAVGDSIVGRPSPYRRIPRQQVGAASRFASRSRCLEYPSTSIQNGARYARRPHHQRYLTCLPNS